MIIVEDVESIARSIGDGLERQGCQIVGTYAEAASAIAAAEAELPDVVLMDVGLAGHVDGIVAAEELYVCTAIPVVLLSGSDDPVVIDRAERAGVYGFVKKPCRIAPLLSALRLAVAKHEEVRGAKGLSGLQRLALDHTSSGVVVTDTTHKILLVNRAATTLLGCRRWDAVSRDLAELLTLPDPVATGDHGKTSLTHHPERTVSFAIQRTSLEGQSLLVWTLLPSDDRTCA
ncbi:MAG: response regulator [Deltaproteobacteria bacterium]|nr:response regulator [Deltaproteobacteria bacterium]